MPKPKQSLTVLEVDAHKLKAEIIRMMGWTEDHWFRFYRRMKAKDAFLSLHTIRFGGGAYQPSQVAAVTAQSTPVVPRWRDGRLGALGLSARPGFR